MDRHWEARPGLRAVGAPEYQPGGEAIRATPSGGKEGPEALEGDPGLLHPQGAGAGTAGSQVQSERGIAWDTW